MIKNRLCFLKVSLRVGKVGVAFVKRLLYSFTAEIFVYTQYKWIKTIRVLFLRLTGVCIFQSFTKSGESGHGLDI